MKCAACGDIVTYQPVLEHTGTPKDLCDECAEVCETPWPEDDAPPVSELYELGSEFDDHDPFEE